MRKNIILIYFNLFLITFSFSQVTNIDSLEAKIDNYFELDYETFFTHVNKTTYFSNEEIWFKTYVYYTKKQLPFISTTNLYTSLYNENGKLIKKKMYAALNGMANGSIKIDSTFKTGIYYLKTDSNWSKNFNLDNTHIQKIEIINRAKKASKKDVIEASYDFQLLPEGGHLVEEVSNTVGFKIVNSLGKSVEITSGKIIDNNNNLITVFKSNVFGLGKFVFKPEKNKQYTCEITLKNGKTITKEIIDIETTGVSLNIENNRVENIIININTNKNTLPDLAKKTYYAIIHRDGLIKKIEVKFSKNKLNYSFNVNRSLLHKGINIITLINENQKPIAERVLFNPANSAIKKLGIKQVIKGKDSSIVKIKIEDNLINNVNLSVSVLPSKTKANNNNSNIVSSFLINPYIKGVVENPWYYFNETNREKTYNLDLLLLTQGWSKYSWENIFNHAPKIAYNFETGFQVKGKINNYKYKDGDKIILQSKQNGILEEFSISESGVFSFNNLFLQEDSNISFSLKDRKNKQTKPNIYYNIYPIKTSNTIKIKNTNLVNTIILDENFEAFSYDKDINILEVVKLKVAYAKPKAINSPVGMSQAKHISFADAKNVNSLITDQLLNYFDITRRNGDIFIYSRKFSGLYKPRSPKVFLDNIDISNQIAAISHLRVLDVEEMFVSTAVSNIYNSFGTIHIFTKRGHSKPTKTTFNDSEISFGFSVPKEYYSPIYNKLNYENFNNYGVLNWIPNVTKDKKGELSFKIPNHYYDSINLYIEGMGADGSLFSKIETITTKKNTIN